MKGLQQATEGSGDGRGDIDDRHSRLHQAHRDTLATLAHASSHHEGLSMACALGK